MKPPKQQVHIQTYYTDNGIIRYLPVSGNTVRITKATERRYLTTLDAPVNDGLKMYDGDGNRLFVIVI